MHKQYLIKNIRYLHLCSEILHGATYDICLSVSGELIFNFWGEICIAIDEEGGGVLGTKISKKVKVAKR